MKKTHKNKRAKNPDKSVKVKDKLKSESKLKKFWRWGVTFAFLFLALNLIPNQVSSQMAIPETDRAIFMNPYAPIVHKRYTNGVMETKKFDYSLGNNLIEKFPYMRYNSCVQCSEISVKYLMNFSKEYFGYDNFRGYFQFRQLFDFDFPSANHQAFHTFQFNFEKYSDSVEVSLRRFYNGAENTVVRRYYYSSMPSNLTFEIQFTAVILTDSTKPYDIKYAVMYARLIAWNPDGTRYFLDGSNPNLEDNFWGAHSGGSVYISRTETFFRIMKPAGGLISSPHLPNNLIPLIFDTAIQPISSYDNYGLWFYDLLLYSFYNKQNLGNLKEITIGSNWAYQSFIINSNSNKSIEFERKYSTYNQTTKNESESSHNFTYDYPLFFVDSVERYYPYSTETIDPKTWGAWEINIHDFWGNVIYTINMNWMRNLLVFVVNAIIFMFQAILYFLLLAFNYLIVWIFIQIIVLLWNYPIYWVCFGVVGIVFYLSFFFVWLWNQAVIVWELVIGPIFSWIVTWLIENVWNPIKTFFRNGGLKILFDFYMIILSYVIATLLWIFTFGTQDFSTIQQTIQTILLTINQTIFEFIAIFLENFVWMTLSAVYYVLLVGLVYVKYIYAKSRGYVQRAARLQSMINVYKLPIVLVVRLVQYVIGFIQGGVPTDGADR